MSLLAAQRWDLPSRNGVGKADFLLGPNADEGDLEYPEAPECTWLLTADVTDGQARALQRRLSKIPSFSTRKLHTPHFSD